MREQKTQDDVHRILDIAVQHNVKFIFYPAGHESQTYCVGHRGTAWIYEDMSPTDIWNEVRSALDSKGVNVNQFFVLLIKSSIPDELKDDRVPKYVQG